MTDHAHVVSRPMRRALAYLLIVATSLPFSMTAVVLVRFHMDRERIIKEVCVQRSRPVEENCCKGGCHLEEQLKAQEAQEQGPQSPPRIDVRVEPAIVVGKHSFNIILLPDERLFAIDRRTVASAGYPSIAEPVPLG